MHSPQRMQRERKSGSSSAPGGRSSRSLRLLPRPVLARSSGTATAPAAMPVNVLPPSQVGRSHFLFFAEEAEHRAHDRGQLPTQFMHIRHSDLRHGAPPMGSSPPWQWSRQRLQLLQRSGSLCSPSTDQRDTAPSSAPSGQIARHQNRVTRKLAARIARNKMPSTSPCVIVRLAEIEHEELPSTVCSDLARRLDRRHVAVLQRRQHRARGSVERRQNRQPEGAHQQTEGIEPADRRRAEARGHQPGNQHNIFDGLPALVAVGLDALLAALGLRGHIAHKVLQRAHGADPAAEEAPQKERGQQDHQAPDQPAIERVPGQRVDQRHQRIPLEEEPHRRAQMNLGRAAGKEAHRGEEQQRKERAAEKIPAKSCATAAIWTGSLVASTRWGATPAMIHDWCSGNRQTVICITGWRQ